MRRLNGKTTKIFLLHEKPNLHRTRFIIKLVNARNPIPQEKLLCYIQGRHDAGLILC